jgi:hypothetical protein
MRASAREPAKDSPTKHRYVVAAIGDSITDTRVGGGLYMKHLAERCPKSRFDVYSIGGQEIVDMRRRFDHDLFGRRAPAYTHVIVFGGVNDLRSGFIDGKRLHQMETDLLSMYRDAHAHHVAVIALTVPLWAPHDRHDRTVDAALAQWISDEAVRGDADVAIDLQALLGCEQRETLCRPYRKYPNDTVHFSDWGHTILADAIADAAFADCE